MQNLLKKLSKTLFWDVDFSALDVEKHAAYIIERVVSRGTLEEFLATKECFGKIKMAEILTQIRFLDDRTLHFCSIYFDTPLSNFRCYTQKQSKQVHWSY